MSAPIDPVDAFFDSVGSTFSRAALGVCAIGAALVIHVVGYGMEGLRNLLAFMMGACLMLAWWGVYGAFFLVGLVAVLTMLISLFVFIRDSCGKGGYFVLFTAAAVYFSPFSFDRNAPWWGWLVASALYALISAIYWMSPTIATFISAWSQPEEEETAAVPPKTSFQKWQEQQANPPEE